MSQKPRLLKSWKFLEGRLFYSPAGTLSIRLDHPNPKINIPFVWDAHILEKIGYAIPWEITAESALKTSIFVWVRVNKKNLELLVGDDLSIAQESESK